MVSDRVNRRWYSLGDRMFTVSKDAIFIASLPFVDAPVIRGIADEEEWVPRAVLDDDEVLDAIAHDKKRAVILLEHYLKEYPGNPVLLCWLSYSYSLLGKNRIAHEILEKNYELNPKHLIVRADYAVYLMKHQKNYDRVPEIFDHEFALDLLYPDRQVFHVIEVSAHYHALGLYFLHKGDSKTVRLLIDAFYEMDEKDSEACCDIEYGLQLLSIRSMMKQTELG